MADVHGLLARIVLVLGVMTAGWAAIVVAGRRPVQPALVGGLAWVVILVVATGVVGVAEAAATGAPSDPLHVVYGILAALVLPGAWAIARTRPDPRRTALVAAVASVVQIILVVRLFQTGG